MDVGSESTTPSLIARMLPLPASTWGTAAVVAGTRTLAANSTASTTEIAATAATAITTEADTIGMNATATTTVGITGTGATVGVPLLGRATRRSTAGVGATPGAPQGVAALAALGTTTLLLPALCLLTATATLAGEATVR